MRTGIIAAVVCCVLVIIGTILGVYFSGVACPDFGPNCPSETPAPPATGTPSPSRTPPATGTPPATPSTCPANKYLSGGSCVNCPAGAYSEAGSSSASACYCGGHTQMNSSRTACVDCPAPAAGYVWSSFIGCDVKLSSSYPPGSRREGQSCERDEDCGGVSPNGYQDTCSPTGFCMSNG